MHPIRHKLFRILAFTCEGLAHGLALVSIRIFVSDGYPAGLCIVEKSNWSGKARLFQR